MRKITSYIGIMALLALIVSCDKQKVKWELRSKAGFSEVGDFTNSSIDISKTIGKSDIVSRADLDGNYEITHIDLKEVIVFLTLDSTDVFPDSISFDLYCDALPLGPSHKGVFKVSPGDFGKKLSTIKVTLGIIDITAINFLNSALNDVIKNNSSIKFKLKAKAIPQGATIDGHASMYVYMDVTYLKCVDSYGFVGTFVSDKGPCN